jgi:ATP-binding cassette subfamily B protein
MQLRYAASMHPLPDTLRGFIWQSVRPYRWRTAFVLLCPIMMAIENTVMPLALKMLVDGLGTIEKTPAQAWQVAAFPVGMYMAMLVAMLCTFRAREWILRTLQPRLLADMRVWLFDYVSQHSHRYFADHFAGAIGAKIGDVARSINALKDFISWRVVPFVSMTLISLTMIAGIAWQLSAMLGVWTVLHLGVSYVLGKRVDISSAQNAEDRSALTGAMVDSISNISIARLFARRDHERRVIGAYQARECQSLQRSLTDIFITRAVTDVLMVALYGGLFYGLIVGWQQGIITLGEMIFVMFTTFFVVEYTWLMAAELPQAFFELGTAQQAYRTLCVPHEVVDAADATPITLTRGEVMLHHVTFRYGTMPPLFSNLSLTIPAGQKVGLVGYSGSGKTTFAHLLLRLYEITEGSIRIDGQNIAHVTQESLRKQVAFIPQDASLFHRSLMENIRYGRVNASDLEVQQAAKQADCEAFIAALPQGYDTLVGERGVKLSGGQRQRIAIARAFLKNAPMLVMDEATSALDSVTEASIQTSLAQLMQGRTTIVIAHRLSTLTQMDRILVFHHGSIVEDGTHTALLAAGGRYAAMWRMQAGGFLPEKEEELSSASA